MASPGAPVVLNDLAAVEAELARLWQANAGSGAVADAPPVLRAASYNLIAVVPSEEDSQRAAAVLAAVMFGHPGRVLILWVDPEAHADRLEAWATMYCRPIGSGPQVCGEQVVISASGRAVERLGGAVVALLLPDCPAVAWWRGGPGPAAVLLDRLAPSLDAVLLDGARFDPITLPRWAARVTNRGARIPVGDLAWQRSAAWRGWTADCFEPEALRSGLRGLNDVRVEYGAGAEMVGLLYVGWLAARLDWPPRPGLRRVTGGGWEGQLDEAGGPIAVTVRPVAADPGLAAVTLEAGAVGLRCGLARQGAQGVLLEVARGADVVQRRLIRHVEPDETALVGHWLERCHWDPIYVEALSAMAAMTLATRSDS